MRFFDNTSLPVEQARWAKRSHVISVCACGEQAWALSGKTDTIMVSVEDRLLIEEFYWSGQTKGNVRYAESPSAEKYVGGGRFLHQNIAIPRSGKIIDHRDGNGLNNMRPNLRDADKAMNAANSRKRRGTRSKFRGVKVDPRPLKKRFEARIRINGSVRWLGRFETEEGAALAYDKAAEEAFGEFARPNFIRGRAG